MDLKYWKNPVEKIKDPLKQRWAEIVQCMDTHINGVCPLHLYTSRRPLESKEHFALQYRADNFQPLTKEAFDLALSKIIDICNKVNIQYNVPEYIDTLSIKFNGKNIYDYCLNDLIVRRENDPNAVVVIIPIVENLQDNLVIKKGVYPYLVKSSEILEIKNNYIRFQYTENEIMIIDNGQYFIEYKDKNNKNKEEFIIDLSINSSYTAISTNTIIEGKYTLNLPYLFGSASWGNKFYCQETDFTVQGTRYTFIKEFRIKENCTEVGMTMHNGVHCDEKGNVCQMCNGLGYIKDDSPLGTIYVDAERLAENNMSFNPITFSEPPQNALRHSQEIMNEYYDRMLDSLGIIKQNMTNQSGVSKSYDYKQSVKIIQRILDDSIMVMNWIYNAIEQAYGNDPSVNIYRFGEIEDNSLDSLLAKLDTLKNANAPASVIENIVDSIYYLTLNPEYSDKIVKLAKVYDILYLYSKDELMSAKAIFGSNLDFKAVIIHNTLIGVLQEYIANNNEFEEDKVIAYLDDYYSKYNATTNEFTI